MAQQVGADRQASIDVDGEVLRLVPVWSERRNDLVQERAQPCLRRRASDMPSMPRPSRASEPGSGTVRLGMP